MEKNSTLRSPRTLLALLVAAAIIVATFLVVLRQLGGAGRGSVEDVGELYPGIPQDGTTLGERDAPVTLYLYEDFQCPFCGQFSREMFPKLVDDYIRDGKVRVVSETMAFLGLTPSLRRGRRSPQASRTVTGPTTPCSSSTRERRTAATSWTISCGASPRRPRDST